MDANTVKLIVGFCLFPLMTIIVAATDILIERKYGGIEDMSDRARQAILGFQLGLCLVIMLSVGAYLSYY